MLVGFGGAASVELSLAFYAPSFSRPRLALRFTASSSTCRGTHGFGLSRTPVWLVGRRLLRADKPRLQPAAGCAAAERIEEERETDPADEERCVPSPVGTSGRQTTANR